MDKTFLKMYLVFFIMTSPGVLYVLFDSLYGFDPFMGNILKYLWCVLSCSIFLGGNIVTCGFFIYWVLDKKIK